MIRSMSAHSPSSVEVFAGGSFNAGAASERASPARSTVFTDETPTASRHRLLGGFDSLQDHGPDVRPDRGVERLRAFRAAQLVANGQRVPLELVDAALIVRAGERELRGVFLRVEGNLGGAGRLAGPVDGPLAARDHDLV